MTMSETGNLLCASLLLVSMSLLALILCPHSKVEESFNLQATRDLYQYGIFTSSDVYDHLQYSGVVPRTFLGPFILSTCLRFWNWLSFGYLDDHPMILQSFGRGTLLLFVLHGHYRLATSLAKRKTNYDASSSSSGNYMIATNYLIITSFQFHLVFYGSRMLPNVFALVFVLHAYAEWFRGNSTIAAALLVATSTIFRCDVIILLFTIGLSLLIKRHLSIPKALTIGIITGILCLLLTVPMDSYLWSHDGAFQLLWPEGQVLFFNTVENKSSEWGTAPWHWYFTNAIPKAMLGTFFLVPLGLIQRQRSRVLSSFVPFFFPILAFVGLYSFLPHKEVRFIFPALPMFNIVAANGLSSLFSSSPLITSSGLISPPEKDSQDENKPIRKQQPNVNLVALFYRLIGIGLLGISLLGSSIFLAVSRHNYPGGQALQLLTNHLCHENNKKYTDNHISHQQIHVYIDVASAMTGISLFGQDAAEKACSSSTHNNYNKNWKFTKAGYEHETTWNDHQHTHILSEESSLSSINDEFRLIGIAKGYPRFNPRTLSIDTQDAIYIYEHNQFGN